MNCLLQLSEFNVTGSSVQGMIDVAQSQVNKTVEDLAQRNPDLGKLLEQVKKGYEGLSEVSKQVGGVVQEHATAAQGDLKTLMEQAKTELTKTATQLEVRSPPYLFFRLFYLTFIWTAMEANDILNVANKGIA